MFPRVLVPLDGSETSEAVLPHLPRIVRRQDSEILLLRVVALPPTTDIEYGAMVESLRHEAEQYLASLAAHLSSQALRVRTLVRVGGEARQILEAADAERASLIAMGTHGRTGLSRLVFGSVTERVLRSSRAPLMVVRADAAPRDSTPLKTILMPVDGSETSLLVLPYVRELARQFGARVLVLGVVAAAGGRRVDPLIREAEGLLGSAGVAVDALVRLGRPASEILDAAKRHRVDLIAMTTHGRSGVGRLVRGSVAEKVVRAARAPMLLVRTHGVAARRRTA